MENLIGQRIAFLRGATTYSQDELAPYLGMSRSNLSGIEIGRISPGLNTIYAICFIFDVFADWLLFGYGEQPKKDSIESSLKLLLYSPLKFGEKPRILVPEDVIERHKRNFAIRLKWHRKNKNINYTLDDIKNKLGIAKSSYNLIEKAKSNVSADVLQVLIRGLHASADLLLFGIQPHHKEILLPWDVIECNTYEEVEKIYQNKLSFSLSQYNGLYDIYKIQKQGTLPIAGLSLEQINSLVALIVKYKQENDEKQV